MPCWKSKHAFGAYNAKFFLIGGTSGHIYVLPKTRGDVDLYNATDGTLASSAYLPLNHSITTTVSASVPDNDGDTLYYTTQDGASFPDLVLRKTTHGGSDTSIGTITNGADLLFWLPGNGLFGFRYNAGVTAYADLVSINTTTAATTLVTSAINGGNQRPLVTSDGIAWWQNSGDGHVRAFDGSTMYDYDAFGTAGWVPFDIETFDPASHAVALFGGSDGLLHRCQLVSGTITELSAHSCAPQADQIYQPLWTWDYVAADGWPNDTVHSNIWRFEPPTGDWHVGGSYW